MVANTIHMTSFDFVSSPTIAPDQGSLLKRRSDFLACSGAAQRQFSNAVFLVGKERWV